MLANRLNPHPLVATHLCLAWLILALVVPSAYSAAGDQQPPEALDADGYLQQDNLADLRESLMQHRLAEAEAKSRLVAAALKAEALKTANQELYDVHYYELDLNLSPSTSMLTGLVTVRAEVTGASISTMDLNLHTQMSVYGVTAGGSGTTYSRAGHVMTVDLDQTYTTGETVEVVVDYGGNPSGSHFGWDSYGGQDMIWTLSEPFGAREWWPCKDLNSDKADSVDIRVTVPDHLTVASNGLLLSNVDNGSTRTFHWKTNYPIVTYLVSLAIHPYTFFNDWYPPQGGGDPMEVQFYVFPDHYGSVQATYALTVPMIDVFAQGFGEYPFLDEKYGHAEFVWGGGMEHQTITSLGGWWEDLISHELAHMWWGDLITCDTFHHIWLNEGFATWCEAYWKEQTEGSSTYQAYMDAAAYYGGGTIYVEDPLTQSIFDGNLSYNKGSWIVHMLRGVLGDTDFFAGLQQYYNDYGYDSATTEQFRDVMETVSGQDLDAFFDQWIYGEYFPHYRYSWGSAGGLLDLTIQQIQTNTGLFEMPIVVRVTDGAGTTDHVVQNSLALENYQLPVTGTVEQVLLDPDRWILRMVETPVGQFTFDLGILLVNGVDWDTYGNEIFSAYEDSAFWGDNPITFWDTFSEPAGGYPANLPDPIGTGSVPGDVITHYSTVIWVGNHYNGDLARWQETPILEYLEGGGNVLLMTRRSQSFLDADLAAYLGITWAETGATLGNCIANAPGLVDIPFTGTQSWNDVYLTTVGPQSTLLFRDTAGFGSDRGTGVHAQPTGGGTFREEGAHFAHIAGRPYRMDHDALRANVEFILEAFFGEPWVPSGTPPEPDAVVARPRLLPSYPNPFNPQTVIPFALPQSGYVNLAVYDAAGRLVRTLVDEERPAGQQAIRWDGMDTTGRAVASGTYFVRMKAGRTVEVQSAVVVR